MLYLALVVCQLALAVVVLAAAVVFGHRTYRAVRFGMVPSPFGHVFVLILFTFCAALIGAMMFFVGAFFLVDALNR